MKTKKISLAVLGAVCCLQMGGVAMAAHEEHAETTTVDLGKQHVPSGAVVEEAKPTANLSVMAMSKYVWRGFELSKDSVVIQPSLTVAYKGFSANIWGNEDTDAYAYFDDPTVSTTNAWTETDFTLAYDWSWEPFGLTVGYIYYGLDAPAYRTDFPDTQEVFARAALHTLLTPTLSIYRDYDNLSGWYITLGVSHSVPLTEKIGLNLGAQVGYLAAEDANDYAEVDSATWTLTNNNYSGFHDGLLTASVAIPVAEYFTVTPMVNYSFPLTSDAADLIEFNSFDGGGSGDNDFVYGGVMVSLAF